MADVKISQLPPATAPQAGDVAPMVSGGVTVKTTAAQVVTAALNATPVTIAQGGTNSTTAPAARTALGLGSIATQDSNNVAITGGGIDNTKVGSVTPADGTFTLLTATGITNITPANANVNIAPTGTGTLSITGSSNAAANINNVTIGATTPAPASVTNLNVKGSFVLVNAGAAGDPKLTIQANDATDLITISPSVLGNTTAGGLLFALGDSSIADWTMAGGDIFPSQGATTMTNGFAFVPGASGAPTGTPINQNQGIHPLYVDSTVGAERLNFYANGSWKTVSGGGGGGGTVTSVATAGNVNGITLTGGPITGSGTITLGGTLDLSAPPAIGGTTANAVSATNLSYTGTLTGGANVVNIGSGQVYKDANGNLGIGTTSPAVSDTGRAIVIDAPTLGAALDFRQAGNSVFKSIASNVSTVLLASGNTLSLGAGGSAKFSVDNNGAWLAGSNAGTAGQAFTSGGAGAAASWTDVQNGLLSGVGYNTATLPNGQALETLNLIGGLTSTLTIGDEGAGDGAAIAAYFTANGPSAVYRFASGDTSTFSIASATANPNSATCTLVLPVTFNQIIEFTNLQIQVPLENTFIDVAVTPSLTGSVALNTALNKQVLTLGLNPPTSTVIGGVKAGANITIAADGTISATGGGGGTFNTNVSWSTGGSSKNAYINQAAGTINNAGITIVLTASFGSGNMNNVHVSLNGTPLSNTYDPSGQYPTYTVTVPAGDIDGAYQTAANVVVGCSGNFSGGNFNISNAGTLTNVQPIPFTTTLSGAYSPNALAFYETSGTINYSYSNSGAITSFGGQITPAGGSAQNANAASGSFASQPIAGATIGGTATGNGQFGAGSSTVTLTGSVTAPTTYIPAFYAQTASEAPPTFSQASSQTAGAAQGSTVTYPKANVSTQYNWICTQRPLANIAVVTPFGNAPFVPDRGGTGDAITQPIGVAPNQQTFNVYGVTGLDTINPIQLVIT